MIERDDPKDEVGSFTAPPIAERRRVVFPIPPSAPVKGCRSCGARVIWIVTSRGNRMPVEAEGERRGESHFAHCPHHREWRTR